jgi:predicted amidophosphoribosyltransferase
MPGALPRLRDMRKPCETCVMNLAREIRAGLNPLVDLIYPPRCPGCGAALAQHGGLCVDCWGALESAGEPACRSCGCPISESRSGDLDCWLCSQDPPRHRGIRAATVYNDISRDLVLKLKHGANSHWLP